MQKLFSIKEIQEDPRKTYRIKNLNGSAKAFFVRESLDNNRTLLIIARNTQEANILEQEISALFGSERVWYFPDWETLPYDTFSPYQDIISRRLEILSRLSTGDSIIVITSVSTAMGRLAPKSFTGQHTMFLKTGDTVKLSVLRNNLSEAGYLLVKQVFEHGEFAIRGSIIDLYPMGSQVPYRIDLFDNEIDTISIFDLESQRSIQKVKEIKLLPAHEFPVDEAGVNEFRKNYRDHFMPCDLSTHNIYQQISHMTLPAGIEYYLPLFFKNTDTLFDYLPQNAIVSTIENLTIPANDFWHDVQNRALACQGNLDHPSLPPKDLFLSPQDLRDKISKFTSIKIYSGSLLNAVPEENNKNIEIEDGSSGALDMGAQKLPPLAADRNGINAFKELKSFIENYKGRIFIAAASAGKVSILSDMLRGKIKLTEFNSFQDFENSKSKLGMGPALFTEGFQTENFALITENELLGFSQAVIQKRGHHRTINPDAVIRNLSELKPGEHLVHEKYGIGLYQGLETLKIDDITQEFVSLLYADNAKMYVPITSLYLLSRYTGKDTVQLTHLGTPAWKKACNKAREKIKDIAAGLLNIYANRKAKKGFAFHIDHDAYDKFSAGFGYQPTDDQIKAISAVMTDMQSEKPMDRLICGDVGFGKTEVAMRAAFIAANNGKQVAILVPTTLLADQHYESFRNRFANTPVEIAVLSRFSSTKEQKDTIERTAKGNIDILIGTHKLLSKNLKFKDLGLLIVDEEHRFGVAQKEKIKKLRAEVDILTMTATPIPRTLNMAMNSIRDLSIIATPPAKRLAVKTFVHPYDEKIIREAVLRELKRGGQTYYLHNNVETINSTAEHLRELIPEARIAVAHAELPEQTLSTVMHDFYHQHTNLLVCSTIIETGLDIPSANTIIMDRADKLGLAQMHQLRGRVGRSHHQAYAYLLTPENSEISKDAKKRLQAIASLEELGSGFILATQDLEIRGAGEILGQEQSGQIESIGFSLYTEMLDEAVKALQEGKTINLDDPLERKEIQIELHIPVLFPENYINDVTLRLTLYKRLAGCHTNDEINDIKAEIIDRFGTMPESSINLIESAKLRILAEKLGITELEMNAKSGSITFGETIHVEFEYLTELISTCTDRFKLAGPSKIRILEAPEKPTERIKLFMDILNDMNKHYK